MLTSKFKFTEKDFDIYDDFKISNTKQEKQKDIKYLPWVEKFRPQELSEIINEIADKLELNEYPYNTCAQMEIMVDHFPVIVGDLVDEDKSVLLTELLKSSSQIEKLYGEMATMDKTERDQMIVALLLASGRLEGLASIIRHME